MNRLELSWALSAVLPHASKRTVGLRQQDDKLAVYATDTYTLGIASVPNERPVTCRLSAKEAGELERWIRPQRIPEKTQEVVLAFEAGELHVAVVGPEGDVEDSAVFTATEGSDLDALLDVLNHAEKAKLEQRPIAVNPAFLGRFAKAGEAVRIEFRLYDPRFGAFLVYAPNFVGLAANLAYWATPGQETEVPAA